ncbi:MAG: BlaI/MecI/CopY family transcriptional regulator [Actinobacteria bacterium]|nr:BlaI/MecI/CopY family transcriptional regulator [Actinomycetota bacterium]
MARTGRQAIESLTVLEMEVMDIAWELNKMSIREVHERISKKKYLPYTTISAVMRNLAKKGVLRQSRDGKVFIYKVMADRHALARIIIDSVVKKLLRGDMTPLAAYLAEKK